MGRSLPPITMSSEAIEVELADLYNHLKLPHGRLEMMTGIKERKFYNPKTRPSDIAAEAANDLFNNSDLKRDEVDLLINASVCRDFVEPATASVVHAKLELSSHCAFFDVSNACLGVLSAIEFAAGAIERGQIKNALITSGENGTPLKDATLSLLKSKINDPSFNRKDIKKFIASLTIGSGGFAIWIGHDERKETDHKLIGSVTLTDSSAYTLCQGDGNTEGLLMETDSEELLKKGVALAHKTFNETLNFLSLQSSRVDWVIGHQVGEAHEKAILQGTGLNKHESLLTHTTYQTWGNTGSAAWGLTLYEASQLNKFKKGSTGLILGIGSGLSSTMLGIKW